jgi:hypothetical protein
MLPFDREQFLAVFVAHHHALWPAQLAAALLFADGVWRARLAFEPRAAPQRWLGWSLVIYAAAVYPVIGLVMGLHWDELPAFGLTPCPVALFTTGCLLLTTHDVPRRLLVIPLCWSLIGGSAALLLGMPQDSVLAASGLALLALWRRREHGTGGSFA